MYWLWPQLLKTITACFFFSSQLLKLPFLSLVLPLKFSKLSTGPLLAFSVRYCQNGIFETTTKKWICLYYVQSVLCVCVCSLAPSNTIHEPCVYCFLEVNQPMWALKAAVYEQQWLIFSRLQHVRLSAEKCRPWEEGSHKTACAAHTCYLIHVLAHSFHSDCLSPSASLCLWKSGPFYLEGILILFYLLGVISVCCHSWLVWPVFTESWKHYFCINKNSSLNYVSKWVPK